VGRGDGVSEASIEQGLIESIERDPANEEAYAVYADWLQAQGSLRGELATLQLGAEEHPGDHRIDYVAERFLRDHAASFLGDVAYVLDLPDQVRLTWRCGFIRAIELRVPPPTPRRPPRHLAPAALLAGLLALESSRFLSELRAEPDGHPDLSFAPAVLAARAPATLRSLTLGPSAMEHACVLGELSGLWRRVPALEELVLHGQPASLGVIELPRLRRATIWLEASTDAAYRPLAGQVAAARWPRLEALQLWDGGSLEEVEALLARADLDILGDLGIVNCGFADEVCGALVRSPLAPQLHRLSLARGTLTDRGVRALAARGDALPNLGAIDVSHTFVTPDGVARLRELAPQVIARGLRRGQPRVQLERPRVQRERPEED
jgi:uncharacterized protein (TIGR02996 family)